MFNEEIKSSFPISQRNAKLGIFPVKLGSNQLPVNLGEELNLVIIRENNAHAVDLKIYRVVDSIVQDICHTTTQGKQKLSKHVGLGMTMCHLLWDTKLLTLLNCFGHFENYSSIEELATTIS